MHALYWIVTHPANKVWLQREQLRGAGKAFFAVGGRGSGSASAGERDWTRLRDRWEYSHVARAALALLSLIALATAATSRT